MNAYEIPNFRFSLPAGGAFEPNRFVAVNSDGNGIQATATTNIVGVSYNKGLSGEVMEVATGILMVETSAAITAGTKVSADANGKAITTPTEGTPVIAGLALTSAPSGGLVSVMVY